MKKGKVKVFVIILVVIVAVVGSVLAIRIVGEKNEEKKIELLKQEFAELLERNRNKELQLAQTPIIEGEPYYSIQKYDLSDMTYTVVSLEKIGKNDYSGMGKYAAHVIVDCVTDPIISSDERSRLAWDVGRTVPGYDKPVKMSTGDEITLRYEGKKDGQRISGVLVSVNVDGVNVSEPDMFYYSLGTGEDKNTKTCKSCGKKYDKSSDNAMSISKTGMCTSCYNNFKGMSDWLKEQPKK